MDVPGFDGRKPVRYSLLLRKIKSLRTHYTVCSQIDSAIMVADKNVSTIGILLKKELEVVSEWLVDNKLSLHLGKTESILIGS